jgi:hypothetical protein
MKQNNDPSVTPIERKILEYIADHPYSIADDIVEDIFNGEEKKRWSVYKYLRNLKDRKLINSRRIDTSLGGSSPYYLYLLTNGSRALCIDHKPVSKRDFSIETFKRTSIIKNMLDICHANGWTLYQDNDDCRYALVSYLKYYDENLGIFVLSDQAYLDSLPKKMTPDMVLAKPGEYVIVILSDIRAGIAQFNNRLIKYKEVLPKVRIISINLNEGQRKAWLTILQNQQPQYYNFSLVQSAKGFLILTYDELDEAETFLSS